MRELRSKIDSASEKIIEYLLYILLFFLPASKAVVEICATLAILLWCLRKIINPAPIKFDLSINRPLFLLGILSLILLIPIAFIVTSAFASQHLDLSLKTPIPVFWALIVTIILLTPLALLIINLITSENLDRRIKYPLLLLIDSALITSMFTSFHLEISLGAFFFKTMEYILIFFVVLETMISKKRIVNVLIVLSVSSLIVAADGYYQQITKYDFFQHFPLFADVKVSATFKFSNILGTYLATILPIFLSVTVLSDVRKRTKAILTALSLLLFGCLLLSQARGAWLSFILGFLFIFIFSGRKKCLFAVSILLMLAVLAWVFGTPLIKAQIRSFTNLRGDLSTNDRVLIWKTGWKMFAKHPLLGSGLGTFMRVYENSKPKDYPWIVYAHNCYLQMAAESGVFGLLFFLIFILGIFRSTVMKFLRTSDKLISAYGIGILSGIVAYLFNSLVDTTLYSLPLAVLFWSFAGLASARIKA